MSDLRNQVEEVLSRHAARLAVYEVREDYPLLRLNKSVHAYHVIATYQTIPAEHRTEVALACASRKTRAEQAVWEAFRNRMESLTLAGLRRMALNPAALEVGGTSLPARGDDYILAIIRRREEGLKKALIRRCFIEQLRTGYGAEVRSCGKGALLYESSSKVGDWDVVTCLDFGGTYQFRCDFSLVHRETEKFGLYNLSWLLGFGGTGWDDVRRASLEADAKNALQLCLAMRAAFSAAVSELQF